MTVSFDVIVRSPGDAAAVMAIMAEAFDPAFGEAWSSEQLAGFLAMPGARLIIAEIDKNPVGFCLAQVIAGEAELMLLAVSPSARRKGAGRLLVRQLLDDLAAAQVEKLFLEVRMDNQHAMSLYEVLGFERIGLRKGYYQNVHGERRDAVTMLRRVVRS